MSINSITHVKDEIDLQLLSLSDAVITGQYKQTK